MATTAERDQAFQILEQQNWTLIYQDGGWFVNERPGGTRIYPEPGSPGDPDPALAVIAALAAWQALQQKKRDREARRVIDRVYGVAGSYIVPKLIPGVDPQGNPIVTRLWDARLENGSTYAEAQLNDVPDHVQLLRRLYTFLTGG